MLHLRTRVEKKYLHRLFPEGPVRQDMPIADLPVPAHTEDASFGVSRRVNQETFMPVIAIACRPRGNALQWQVDGIRHYPISASQAGQHAYQPACCPQTEAVLGHD